MTFTMTVRCEDDEGGSAALDLFDRRALGSHKLEL